MAGIRIITNAGNNPFLFAAGKGATMPLSPFSDRNGNVNQSVCFAVLDCLLDEEREGVNTYISRRFAQAVPPAMIYGLNLCNIHVAKGGKITALSNLPPGLCGVISEDYLRKNFKALFREFDEKRGDGEDAAVLPGRTNNAVNPDVRVELTNRGGPDASKMAASAGRAPR